MTSPYDGLFHRYVAELRAARTEALAWWEALRASAGDETHALALRWPCGAASHPRVIGVFRQYVLECEQLTERLRQQEDSGDLHQAPTRFLLDNLETVDAELGHFMEAMVFSPMGINVDDQLA